ncbi:hypothetical protein PR371_11215 [Mycobacterium marinum]|uniref:hypothetical protein n=1 Tax=Mycobacterium marinum TaxID=1781 RepID=UPI00114058CD|nr:hypothetical protein [Mycobacterium marinum]MDC8994554.1 hypothetical protein [Mycobacterium marinum]WDZ13278.1 hypothetical protein PQR73_022095 [Mycobacterium marinum]
MASLTDCLIRKALGGSGETLNCTDSGWLRIGDKCCLAMPMAILIAFLVRYSAGKISSLTTERRYNGRHWQCLLAAFLLPSADHRDGQGMGW